MLDRQRRSLILVGGALMTLAGCFTGERPTLVVDQPIDDPAAQAVVSRLDRAGSVDFIASYDIIPSLTGATTQATVAQIGSRRKIAIGNVRFISDSNGSRTCDTNIAGCVDFLDDARISDLGVTNAFWGPAFASRLKLDASRRIGPSVDTTTTIAGRPGMCVDVTLPSSTATTGTVLYCALDDGVLARYFGADVSIELTSFSLDVNEDDLSD